jgi:YYY domain-containing protein
MTLAETPSPVKKLSWLYDLLFAGVLLAAAFLRLSGSDWGQYQNQHPDENFLVSVTLDIAPIGTDSATLGPAPHADADPWHWRLLFPDSFKDCTQWGGYFDTSCSPLNPHNRGHGFFTYGTLPIFIVRGLADLGCQVSSLHLGGKTISELLNVKCPLNNIILFGRQMSGLADLLTILLLYILAARLYNRRVALLAAAFSALAVMQIQQSHFYTTDNFATLFMFLTILFAVEILISKQASREAGLDETDQPVRPVLGFVNSLLRDRLFWLSLGFGLAYGMALASKLTAFPLALLLPFVFLIRAGRDSQPGGRLFAGTDWMRVLACLFAGGLMAFLSFRVFQPYAFLGFGLNPQWVANIKEQRLQASPNADLAWALQWARRSHLYSFQNMTVWGLGLPLGILAWAGFLWMGWRSLRGEWHRHLLLWGWTAVYFTWQSLQYNPTMRYELPIYPLLALMAAWLTLEGFKHLREAENLKRTARLLSGSIRRALPVLMKILGFAVLALTLAWAYAFSRIYTRTETRVAASNWIFENVPGPINLHIRAADTGGSIFQQPLPFYSSSSIRSDSPSQVAFVAQASGLLQDVFLPHVTTAPDSTVYQLTVSIWRSPPDAQPLAVGVVSSSAAQDLPAVTFDQSPWLTAGQEYTLRVEMVDPVGSLNLCETTHMSILGGNYPVDQPLAASPECLVSYGSPYLQTFSPQASGNLAQVVLGRGTDPIASITQILRAVISITPDPQPDQVLASASASADFSVHSDARGDGYTLSFPQPVPIEKGQAYYLRLETDGSALTLTGASFANETDYDYGLPMRTGSYDPFGGLYRGDLNLQVYWPDDADKLARFESVLSQADYLFIPTNHQYGQITRLPERYPLTTVYYRALLGCPTDKEIIWCYRHAEPGMFHGSLGFELAATFESYPSLGPIVINDQPAEEAFTFYDHPKVLIFRKTADYDPARVAAILGSVDTSKAIHLLPGQFAAYKTLLLPPDRLAAQQAGGTWSELFDINALYNRLPGLGAVLWYLFIFALGLVTYPLVRAAFPGLADGGYPLARTVGLLLWSWLAWMAGSAGLPYSKLTIAIALGLVALLGGWQAWRQRVELKEELRTRWKYFLIVEIVFLAFFLLDLGIRLGNPDLWHPSKGGERPMDFAYFNAVLKSTTFPPYDPWFAGGYLNYYYYGYVIVATPVKLLGIVPSIAYNFLLPTLFACLAMAAFSVVWNLLERIRPAALERWSQVVGRLPFLGGLSASTAMVLLGNLGIVRMLVQGFQRMAAPGGVVAEGTGFFLKLWWTLKGLALALGGLNLPYGPGDWYWFPSRALPDSSGGPITEFPLFTFLYSDLHAHMIALMLTVVAIAWVVSVLLSKARWKDRVDTLLGLFMGGLVIGSLRPTNTWDFYTYLILGCVVLAYSVWRYADLRGWKIRLPYWAKQLLVTGGALALLVGFSQLLYAPFAHWFWQGYNSLEPWKGSRSDLTSYLVHWGVFLFFIVSWMAWETRQWMAQTPAASLTKLRPFKGLIYVFLALILLALLLQQAWVMSPSQNVPNKGMTILWLALPLAVWAAVLLFRPGLPDAKRLVLFLVGTSLLLTMVVELVVVTGDIGRMNTVFKFYLQAWVMLGICAAAAFGWLLVELPQWASGWRTAWQVLATLLVSCAALFLLVAGMGKIKDRMNPAAPHSLDSMEYMAYAQYADFGTVFDLSQDYRAIRWMQENVQGSPVIVEAAAAGVQYTWFARYSIYTGLPDVVGWQWHQEQQRVLFTQEVRDRGQEENDFYTTTDIQAALNFLHKYNARYIIVGQLERAKYAGDGLAKFEGYNGIFWNEVYRDGQTVIYELPAVTGANP